MSITEYGATDIEEKNLTTIKHFVREVHVWIQYGAYNCQKLLKFSTNIHCRSHSD